MRNHDYNIQPSEKTEKRITNLPRTKEMKKYIIEIISSDKPTYYTRGSGDPSRTTIPFAAQTYDTEESASNAVARLKFNYPYRKFRVRAILVKIEFID